MTIRLWDISKGAEKLNIDCHTQLVQSLDWNYNGDLLTTTCKDKKLRVIDARTGKVASVSIFQKYKYIYLYLYI